MSDQYAGKKGSVWFIKPTEKATVFDFTDEGTRDRVAQRAFKDYEAGRNTPPEIDGLFEEYGQDAGIEKLKGELDLPDIVDTAGWFDNNSFNTWLYDAFEVDFVTVSSGAIVVNPDWKSGIFKAVKARGTLR